MVERVVFCWSGFPQYAARLVGAFAKAHPEADVRVVATRPRVPVEGMERLCGCPVTWLDSPNQSVDESGLLSRRTVVFATGWHVPAFMRLCAAARKAGGRAICMVDNNFVEGTDLRSRFCAWVKSVRFRLCKRRLFDGFMVPGKSGCKLLKSWGVADELIHEGMYSADATLFRDGGPLALRPKRMIYVGQFSERKNVARLVEAFRRANDSTWELHLFGCGPVDVRSGDGVVVHPFAQPEDLAEEYRRSRVFCLPSVEEHWGLVVHEAALSGCVLALSNRVGAADDFFAGKSGVLFDPHSVDDMVVKLRQVMRMTAEELEAARAGVLSAARAHGIDLFVGGVECLCHFAVLRSESCAIIRT